MQQYYEKQVMLRDGHIQEYIKEVKRMDMFDVLSTQE
jgi:hypothetical protein